MAYREVAMVDVKEVLRLWMAGVARKRIAAQLGLDPKTVRRYVRMAGRAGLRQSDGERDRGVRSRLGLLLRRLWVLIPDNTKAIVELADPLQPHVIAAIREYSQARGFHVDPTRVRHPRDKARGQATSLPSPEPLPGGPGMRPGMPPAGVLMVNFRLLIREEVPGGRVGSRRGRPNDLAPSGSTTWLTERVTSVGGGR
jgi:hypothetical protein